MALQALDEGTKTVGTVYIWFKIIGSAIGAILFAVAAVLVGLKLRKGWVSKDMKMEKVTCKDTSVKKCSGSGSNQTCTSSPAHSCTFSIEGHPKLKFSKVYKEKIPTDGTDIKVYYDPDKIDETMTIANIPKTMIVWILSILAVVNLIWMLFLFAVRNNQTAQRVGGVMGAIDLAQSV